MATNPSAPSVLSMFIDRLSRRSDLGEDDRNAILRLPVVVEDISAGRDFVRLGAPVDGACLVVDGLIGRFGQTASGKRQITAIYISGDIADLQVAVLPQTGTALHTLRATKIARIRRASLSELALHRPAIAVAFWRDCMVDASILARWTINIGRKSAQERLAHFLCEMAARHESIGRFDKGTFSMPMTQEHYGDVLGLTSVHVNRSFKALRDAGLIGVEGRTITILEKEALGRLADFDRTYLLHKSDTAGSKIW